jgi:ABC-2 type transport system permease protein
MFMFRTYLEFARKAFQKKMQYRVANLAGLFTNFFFAAVRIFVFTAFYEAQTEPQPLNLNEVVTYVCLTQAFLMVMPLFWGRNEITEAIKDGSVALQLVKPVDFQGYWFADEIGKAIYYVMMRAIPTFVLAKMLFNMWIPLDLTIILPFVVSMGLAIVMTAVINIAVFATVFWTLDATGIQGFGSTIVIFFSGFLVPIALWPEWLQQVAGWMPFEGVVHLPFSIYLGKLTGAAVWVVFGKQLFWVLVFIGLGRLILHRGFARLVVQGG